MSERQRTWGQYATPTDVADLLLGFCLRRPDGRVLDPSCGAGALLQRAARWQRWLASAPDSLPPQHLTGVELDEQIAAVARRELPQARILTANFFTLSPEAFPLFDTIIGNPPYTRAEWIDRLHPVTAAAPQSDMSQKDTAGRPAGVLPATERPLIPPALRALAGGRAGLHTYFFLHSMRFLRENGRLGFIVPNGWLDVAYGRSLKQFLLDHFRLIAIVESKVERWFGDAGVNTCLVVLEKCADPAARAGNLLRMIQLTTPLLPLLGDNAGDNRRVAAVEQLVTRLLPAASRESETALVQVQRQGDLVAGERWGRQLRAPAVYLQLSRQENDGSRPLKSWATIRRGFTTGANTFFYLDEATIKRWGIEARFRRPALKSLRDVQHLRLEAHHRTHDVLAIPAGVVVPGTALEAYLAWGEAQGIHLRSTCSGRQPWYRLPEQAVAHLALPKGIWQRHFAPILAAPLYLDQQLYAVYLHDGVELPVAAALLNSAWFALQCELEGRVNLGEGVLWLASYELENIHLPDPRHLPAQQAAQLAESFLRLAQRPLQETSVEQSQADRQQLDEAVFDVLGLAAAQRAAIYEALQQRINARVRRARLLLSSGA
jgi:hypothetical protein